MRVEKRIRWVYASVALSQNQGEGVYYKYMDEVSEIPHDLVAVESVSPVPGELIHPDGEFPVIPIKSFTPEMIAQACAKQVRSPADTSRSFHSRATKFLGRGLFGKAVMLLVSTLDKTRQFSSILTKSTGVPTVVRTSWPGYKGHEKDNFFYSEEKEQTSDARQSLIRRADFAGTSLKEDQLLDAKNSLLLHNLGAKVRLPLSGWRVDEFYVYDHKTQKPVARDLAWFKAQGYKGDQLYQSAWGMSCPLRLEDVNELLGGIVEDETVHLGELNQFLDQMFALAKVDKSSEYQNLSQKWADRLKAGTPLSQAESATALEDFGIALSGTMGRNYQILYANGLRHGNLHDQNISFFGELCDNSMVSKGLLQIGLAPENSADISGFNLAISKYSKIIMSLRGENYKDNTQTEKYTEEAFFPHVKDSWESYTDFCESRWQSDISGAVETNRNLYTKKLEDQYNPEEISEGILRQYAIRRLGRKSWPFGQT